MSEFDRTVPGPAKGLIGRKINSLVDYADRLLCRVGAMKPASWLDAMRDNETNLYAGKLYRRLPQFRTHWGITPFFPSTRNIAHDVTDPYPIPDNIVDSYQSEDVFEHIELERMPAVLAEIYRVLKPGGLFRLSVPDYRFDLFRDRSQKDSDGNILFDPIGGGAFVNGRVTGGGHLWYPTIETVRNLFEDSPFASGGTVNYLHYTRAEGTFVLEPIDYSRGYIQRVPDHDARAIGRRRPISIVVDAYKDQK